MNQSAILSNSFKEKQRSLSQNYNSFLVFVLEQFSTLCHMHGDSEADSISICFEFNT